MIQVVKLGGAVLEDDALRQEVLLSFASMKGPKVLVHGGGREADKLADDLGIAVQKVAGRRVTDATMLKLVTMMYGGWLNKRVVAELQALGVDALGLSGADANLLKAQRRPAQPIDFGYVGDVQARGVNQSRLKGWLTEGTSPVICAITHDGAGQLLNTNADTMSSVIAQALVGEEPVGLQLCFEKPGVLTDAHDGQSVVPSLTYRQFETMKASGQVVAGMIPKLTEGFRAIASGVSEVWVKASQALNEVSGTRLISE